MSLTIDGVWKVGVWATTVWADGVWREGAWVPTADNTVLNSIGGKPEKKKKKKYGEEYTWEWLYSLDPRVKEVVEQVAKEGLEEKTVAELKKEKKPNNELFAKLENAGIEARYFNDVLQLRIRYINDQIKLITERIKQQEQEEIDVLTILMMEL